MFPASSIIYPSMVGMHLVNGAQFYNATWVALLHPLIVWSFLTRT